MSATRKCMFTLAAAVLSFPVFASSGTGGEVTYDGDYAVHTFTNGGTFVFSGGEVEVLLVGGGGGGGAFGGGGGGGGQVVSAILTLPADDYPIVIGEGGVGGTCTGDTPSKGSDAENGGTTTAFDLTAIGGGGGGTLGVGKQGASGGGGGAGAYNADKTNAGGSSTWTGGFSGGQGQSWKGTNYSIHPHSSGGGGGGAGGIGENTHTNSPWGGGVGGVGVTNAITGVALGYGGGGGGGTGMNDLTVEGKDGGGNGGGRANTNPKNGSVGTDGFGGGGGGGGRYVRAYGNGGRGGCGVVIVRYNRVSDHFEKVEATNATRKRDGKYHVYTFSSNGTFKVEGTSKIEVLLVGGGGGGGAGRSGGGGGGAGGFVYKTGVVLTNGTYEISVGAGGVGGVANTLDSISDAENGSDTLAFDFVAHGGGAGATGASAGSKGGSGGGGAPRYTTTVRGTYAGGASYEGEGYPGGCSTNETTSGKDAYHTHAWAGGGGGAGQKGGDAVSNGSGSTDSGTTGSAGKGGDGLSCSITGTEVWYAGGGGGGYADYDGAKWNVSGGKGGGGRGSGSRTTAAGYPGEDGKDGFGGGGGGGGSFGSKGIGDGGKGGDGVVIVRCKVAPKGLMLFLK